MSLKPLKITFHLDGTGVFYDPFEPTHLDGLLAWSLAAYHVSGEPPRRDDVPADIPLPLARWDVGGSWGWHASAIMPEGEKTAESLQYWRKRIRESHLDLTSGSPNRTNGIYRDWQMPMPLTLTKKMVAYAVGDRGRVHQILRRRVKYIGKKASIGKGRVVGVDCEVIDNDWSLVKGGVTMRWMPQTGGTRIVRPRPPYWNVVGRVECCEIGAAPRDAPASN